MPKISGRAFIELYDEDGLTIELFIRLTHSWLITFIEGDIIDMYVCNNVRLTRP